MLGRSNEHRRTILNEIAASVNTWSEAVVKMKGIFHVMNMFTTDSRQCLVARCWVPVSKVSIVQTTIAGAASREASAILNPIPCGLPRPTYFETNKFTAGFLAIVEAYGVANYQEVNPGMPMLWSVSLI